MTTSPLSSSRDPRTAVMAASLLVAFLMLAGKITAYVITGSAAIYSDAAESVIHLLATGFVAFSLWYAVRPPDAGHPYGHGKIAYVASGFEGALIFVAAGSILYASIQALLRGPEVHRLGSGFLIIAGLTLLNLLLGWALVRTGERHNSIVLISNGKHVLTDMWTSLGVLVGVGLVWLTDILWLDPVVAILMAFNIAWTGVKLMKQAMQGLMERVDEHVSQAILAELDAALERGLIDGYHQVRHRRVNDQVWVEYHVQFRGNVSLIEAHDRAHVVEDALMGLFPKDIVVVTAHLEPEAHEEAHPEGHREPVDPLLPTS